MSSIQVLNSKLLHIFRPLVVAGRCKTERKLSLCSIPGEMKTEGGEKVKVVTFISIFLQRFEGGRFIS